MNPAVNFSDAENNGQQSAVVNDGTEDRNLTVKCNSSNVTANEDTVDDQTLERCFNVRVVREMGTVVDTVEDRIQNAISTAIEFIITPRIELAVRSINASSGRDAARVSANLERGERTEITALFENASIRNSTFNDLNANDETRGNIPSEVIQLSVPVTNYDRQPHTHQLKIEWKILKNSIHSKS